MNTSLSVTAPALTTPEHSTTMTPSTSMHVLRRFGAKLLLPALLASVPCGAWALNEAGPLQEVLIDAALGDLGDGEARSILGRLNQFDLSAYSLTFSDGSSVPLNTDSASLDRLIGDYENRGLDAVSLSGPSGSLNFGSDSVGCSQGDANFAASFESNALSATESCIGVRQFQRSVAAAAASGASQANTLDLVLSRPSGQFMNAVHTFTSLGRLGSSRGTGASGTGGNRRNGGGSGDGQSWYDGPWGIYLNGGGSFGDINSAPGRTGLSIRNEFSTGGFDYRFSDAVLGGFLFNYTASRSSFAGDIGTLDTDMYRFMPFLSITPFANAYIDLLAGYTYQVMASRRSVTGTQASSDYSADQAMAAINLGYTHAVGGLEITGYAGGSFIATDVGASRERGKGVLQDIGAYHLSSWTSTLGLELAHAFSLPFGVLQPHLRMEWVHEFPDDRPGVQVLVPAQNLSFAVPVGRGIEDWGNVGAGVQAILPRGIAAYVNYQAQLMSAGENHTVEGGVRLEF